MGLRLYDALKPRATLGLFGFYPIRLAGMGYVKAVRRWPRVANLFDFAEGWKVTKTGRGLVVLERGDEVLAFDHKHAAIMLSEILVWKDVYLPKFPLQGKTVLDVGAGCGETAEFFFHSGAKKVIAVESDVHAAGHIADNARMNDWDIEIYPEPFKLEHLGIPHDFLKMDIEGGEKLLLGYTGSLGPCRMEIHPELISDDVKNKIVSRFGLEQVQPGVKPDTTGIWGHC